MIKKNIKEYWLTYLFAFIGLIAITMIVLASYASIHQASVNGGYIDGTKMVGSLTDQEDSYKFSNLGTYWLIIAFAIISVLSLFVFLGAWLRGANWINKTNPYVKGEEYERDGLQKIVLRSVGIIFGLMLLWSFFTEMFLSDVLGSIAKNQSDSKGAARNVLNAIFNDYLLQPSRWYYQCFLSSLIIGFALLFRKYKWMPMVLPLTFLGALRTFVDIKGDWGEDAMWNSLYFHRFMMVHLMIFVAPLFIMVATRQHYSLVNIKKTVIYTFFMIFIAYLILALGAWSLNDNSDPAIAEKSSVVRDNFGEIHGLSVLMGKDADFVETHFHVYFWLMYIPFGITLIALLIFIYEFFFFKSEVEGSFGERWKGTFKLWASDYRINQKQEFKESFKLLKESK